MSAESWAEETFAYHALAGSLSRKFEAAGISDPRECHIVSSELPIGEAVGLAGRKFVAVVGGKGNVRDIELYRIKRLA